MLHAYVCGSPHETLANIVHSVAMKSKAVWLIATFDYVLDVLADILVQLLKYCLGFLHSKRA